MNELIELELSGIAHGGAAIGRHEGRVIFVHYGLPGEKVRVRVTADKERFASGVVEEVLEASPDRVEPPCPHFGPGLCGNCQWQFIAYERQLILKREIVADQFQRIGKFKAVTVLPTIPSPEEYGYRAHMTFSAIPGSIPTIETDEEGNVIGEETEGLTLGFYNDEGKEIIPIDQCLILSPILDDIYQSLSLGAPEIDRVKFQTGGTPENSMIILQTSDDLPPEIEVDFPVSVNFLLSDNEPANLIGSAQVRYPVFDRTFRVTAGGFFQINQPMAEVLVEEVLARLDLTGTESILDLYSGVGMLTAFIAEHADWVLSVESYPPAVTDADVNLADLDNVDLVEGTVEDVLDDLDEVEFDAVVLDPPRAGLNAYTIKKLLAVGAPKLVYVGSDPATLARDCKQLCTGGYKLVSVQPIDMFPQSYYIECVALLERK